MINLGNSCYINSVVQALFAMQEMKDHLLGQAAAPCFSCPDKNPANCYRCQMNKLAIGLASGEYSAQKSAPVVEVDPNTGTAKETSEMQHFQDGVRIGIFKSLFGKGHAEFSSGRQQDAREYFSHLLEKMQMGENKHKSG